MQCILADRLYVPEEYVTPEHLNGFVYDVTEKSGVYDFGPFETVTGSIRTFGKVRMNGEPYYSFARGNMEKLGRLFGDLPWVDKTSAPKMKSDLQFKGQLHTWESKQIGQQEAVDLWLRRKSGIIKAPPRFGKCTTGDAIIHTEEFGSIPIERLFSKEHRDGEFVDKAINIATKDGVAQTLSLYKKTVDETIVITTKRGFTIEATPNHPLFVKDKSGAFDWKVMKDIRIEDRVALQAGTQVFSNRRSAYATVYAKYIKANGSNSEKVMHRVMRFDKATQELFLNEFIKDCEVDLASVKVLRMLQTMLLNFGYISRITNFKSHGYANQSFLCAAHEKWEGKFGYPDLDLDQKIPPLKQNIAVLCTECNATFKTNVHFHLYATRSGGCPACAKRMNVRKGSTESFIKLAVEKWGAAFDYQRVNYKNVDTAVEIYCHAHGGYFFLTPYKHLNNKYGCPTCGNKRKNDHTKLRLQEDFMVEISRREKEGELDLSRARYTSFLTPVELGCKACGTAFSVIGQYFVNGGGRCPVCHPPRSFSKPSQDAIRQISAATCLTFISGLNGYEYCIKKDKNKFKVDAYNEELNLIIEFYGDLFHGNPQFFDPNDNCHPYYKDVTAQELYGKTKEREKWLLAEGYRLITIWDSEWKSDQDVVLARVIRQINKLRNGQCD